MAGLAKSPWLGAGIFLLIAANFFGLFGWYQINYLLEPVNAQPQAVVQLEIPSGSSTADIADLLISKNLIRNATFFRAYTRWKGLDGRLQAGMYAFNPNESLPEIMDKLIRGNVITYSFTIPEGYTIMQIADLLSDLGYVNREKFLQLVREGNFNFPFLQGLPLLGNRLEGFLFPDTYHVTKGISEEKILNMMLNRFQQVLFAEAEEHLEAGGLSVIEWVTIASLIEKETRLDEERTKIAGVIYNRLNRPMRLQIDATVLYALGEHKGRVLYADLKVESPYNTYENDGLPPGPIAAPGEASLLAALYPEEHDYYYYVLKPDGTHAFAKTYAQHNANRKKYQ